MRKNNKVKKDEDDKPCFTAPTLIREILASSLMGIPCQLPSVLGRQEWDWITRLEIENMEKALWNQCGWGLGWALFMAYSRLLCWDDENEIGERVWMGLEIESVEMVLPVWIMTGAGFLLKLTLLEAESDSY
jgi:hypothetical protein